MILREYLKKALSEERKLDEGISFKEKKRIEINIMTYGRFISAFLEDEFKEIEDKKFHMLRKNFLKAYNTLNKYIDSKLGFKDQKKIETSTTTYGDFIDAFLEDEFKEIEDKKFHMLRKNFLKAFNTLNKYID